jgi:dipeptidyl aminopeptidase/acylaminoacyl peptidase
LKALATWALAAASLVPPALARDEAVILASTQNAGYLLREDGSVVRRFATRSFGPNMMACSPDGGRLYGPDEKGMLASVDREGGILTRLADAKLDFGRPIVPSPDGIRVAVVSHKHGDREPVLHVVDSRTGELSKFSVAPGFHALSWSPDGSRLAVATTDGISARETVLVDVDSRKTRSLGGATTILAWSPDGRRAVSGAAGLETVDMTSGERRVLVRGVEARSASWSPDGKLIAFRRTDWGGAGSDVMIVGADGSAPRIVSNRGARSYLPRTDLNFRHPTWSPDGSRVMAIADSRGYGDHGPSFLEVRGEIYFFTTDGKETSMRIEGSPNHERIEYAVWCHDRRGASARP